MFKQYLKLICLLSLIIVLFCSCSKKEKSIEPQPEVFVPQWFETAAAINSDYVDVLFFAGTEIDHVFDADGNELYNITLTEAEKERFNDENYTAWTQVFPDSVNFLAPYYHQLTMWAECEAPNCPEKVAAFNNTINEVKSIFRYYMDNINKGRKFIVAGFSQGALMSQNLISSMTEDDLSKLVAVYSIGFGIINESPKIKVATGQYDKGVIVSFNSAASKSDIWNLVTVGTQHCINPANWKTDDTPATFKFDGMELTNHIDPETHVIFVDGFDFDTHPSVLPGCTPQWTEHNLHVWEVRMYSQFLRKNVKDRAYRGI